MTTMRYGPRTRVEDLKPGMLIVMPWSGISKIVQIERVRPIDSIYTALHTTGGTMWQLSPRHMVTTVVPQDEPLSGTQSA